MKFNTFTAVAAVLGVASAAKDERTFAVLRFNNKALTRARVDPIVAPGGPGPHVHNVMGGSNFGMNSTGEELMHSECSNAKIKGDNSNYWYPALMFKDPKTGELEDVELFYVNAYYFFEPTNDDIKAFPVGLSMVSGDAHTRVAPAAGGKTNLDPSKGPVNAIKWTCPRSNYDIPSYPADSDGKMAGIGDPNNKGEGVGFPDMNCDGYASPLRADMHFPSCYNPAVGLTDYKNNMDWPRDNGDGKHDCPKGYIHVPHLFIEVYWNTPAFKDRWTEGKGQQPFVLSNGDATGYSSHGDFMAGWDEKLLQHIIDTCDAGTSGMDKCPGLFYGLNEGDCTIPPPLQEKTLGTMMKLPGNNPIQGWQYGLGSGGGGDGGHGGSGSPTTTAPASGASSHPAGSKSSSNAPAASDKATEKAIDPTNVLGSKPTNVLGSKPSKCTRRIHTVWETVTVTAAMPDHTKQPEVRRHMHEHAMRHRGLH